MTARKYPLPVWGGSGLGYSTSAIVGANSFVLIDLNPSICSGCKRQTPDNDDPASVTAHRQIELCFCNPCIVGGNCLTRYLNDARLLCGQRSGRFDMNRGPLRAGHHQCKSRDGKGDAHTEPNAPSSATAATGRADGNRDGTPLGAIAVGQVDYLLSRIFGSTTVPSISTITFRNGAGPLHVPACVN